MADLPAAVQASKLMDLVRAGKAYDHEHRPRFDGRNWQGVPDDQAARIIVGALTRLMSDIGGEEEDGDG